uniref:Uncharacterized protein n=1 Tax=Oryza sativa subsp. japonica TaxID=39947 RepID=Q6Z167_ORYSJ|nr:hypothetical protein [Oryza sativa Japonica Group]BAD31898.1 hypothetical protein [Oryza sativa Japonica Group]
MPDPAAAPDPTRTNPATPGWIRLGYERTSDCGDLDLRWLALAKEKGEGRRG